MKCRRQDFQFKRLSNANFFLFTVLSELCTAVASAREESPLWTAGVVFIRIPFWFVLLRHVNTFRDWAGALPDEELSHFLVNYLLKKAMGVIGTITFFSFESLACVVGKNSLEDCSTTISTMMFLASYLGILFISDIFVRCVGS